MTVPNVEQLAALRAPFAESEIDLLPKPTKKDAEKGRCRECGGWHGLPSVHLSYVGHAALTARLLDVDPAWSWEPVGLDERGLPALDQFGGLWIRLHVAGQTRLGYGDGGGKRSADGIKEAIGDALRNAAMRFGCALDLWRKTDRRVTAGLHGDAAVAASVRSSSDDLEPRSDESAGPRQESLASSGQIRSLNIALGRYGLDRAGKLAFVSGLVGRELASSKELTIQECRDIAKVVRDQLAERDSAVPPEATS